MCLIFLSLNNHPDYKLIVAANRDEFYNRKTAPADFWNEDPSILAGRDLEAGGSWMGIHRSGRLSMVTNYRDPHNINPQAPSRGHLVTDYLTNGMKPLPYLEGVATRGKEYNGFNLIVGTPSELYYYSNYKAAIEPIVPGLHGLSNHLLNTPWPKVVKGIDKMKDLLNSSTVTHEVLLDALFDDQRAVDSELPDTGVGLERERALSSMFIKSPGYGSRSSTVLLVDRSDQALFVERTYDLSTFDFTTKQYRFPLGGEK